jgi:DNA-binding response OmpR family regulator
MSDPHTTHQTVLLVEDEPTIRDLIAMELEDRGFQVLQAEDLASAEDQWHQQQGRVDVLITDVMLTDGNGREIVERLRALEPSLKAIYVSGHTERHISRQGMLSPGTTFLQKPFSGAELAERLEQVLRT